TVTASNVHQFAQDSGIPDLAGLDKSGMKPMIEANLYGHFPLRRKLNQWLDFLRISRGGFLDQHGFLKFHRGYCDFGEHVIGGGNDDRLACWVTDNGPPVGKVFTAWILRREPFGPAQLHIRYGDQLMSRSKSHRSFGAHKSAADDSDFQTSNSNPRSCGTMRRSVNTSLF